MRVLFTRRFWVLEVAALAVAALFAASGVGELLAGAVAAELDATGSTSAAGSAARSTAESHPVGAGRASAGGVAILERNLFDSAVGPLSNQRPRGAGVPERRGELDGDVSGVAIGPCTGGRLEVLATVSARADRAESFALLAADGKHRRHREGDEVAGLRVEEIGWRYVLLSNRERELCRLGLY